MQAMIRDRWRTGVIALVLLCVTRPAGAWGHEGHRIVARIAARNLTPATRSKIALILGTNDAGLESAMASAATWPDEIDKAATATESWHFINVPVAAAFSIVGLCPNHNCVLDRISDIQNRLATNLTGFALAAPPSPPLPMTAQEMAFLIHFVGDVHQPLHAATDADRGGNCVALVQPLAHADGTQTTELHAVWDVDEVLAMVQALGGSEDSAVAALFQRVQGGASVVQLTPTDWAHEANDLARTNVYQALRLPNRTAPPAGCAPGIAKVSVTQAYLAGNLPDVETQIIRAGIRLSNVLNQICAGTGCAANP